MSDDVALVEPADAARMAVVEPGGPLLPRLIVDAGARRRWGSLSSSSHR